MGPVATRCPVTAELASACPRRCRWVFLDPWRSSRLRATSPGLPETRPADDGAPPCRDRVRRPPCRRASGIAMLGRPPVAQHRGLDAQLRRNPRQRSPAVLPQGNSLPLDRRMIARLAFGAIDPLSSLRKNVSEVPRQVGEDYGVPPAFPKSACWPRRARPIASGDQQRRERYSRRQPACHGGLAPSHKPAKGPRCRTTP